MTLQNLSASWPEQTVQGPRDSVSNMVEGEHWHRRLLSELPAYMVAWGMGTHMSVQAQTQRFKNWVTISTYPNFCPALFW